MQQRSKSHSTPVRAPSDNVSQRVGNNNNPSNNITSSTNSNNNNSNGPPVVNTEAQQVIKGLEWVLGLSIRVKTLNDDEYEGQIYAYDPKTNCVVLQCPSSGSSVLNSGHPQKYDFRILKINFLKEVFQLPNHKSSIDINANITNSNSTNLNNSSITNITPTMNGQSTSNSIFSTIHPSVGYVQMDRLQSKELLSVKDTQAALARIGVGVTQEAQEIFDALSKTLPCRWHKESIVVLDEVIISSPYDIENCKASSSSSGSLARVKKVLEGEKRRLASAKK